MDSTKERVPPLWNSTRMMVIYMGAFGFIVSFAMRIGFTIAIVAMVNSDSSQDTTELSSECPSAGNSSSITEKEFNWSQNQVGIVLGSFYIGYTIGQIPSGWLSTRYGGKWIFGLGMLVSSVSSIMTPFIVRQSVYGLIILRLISGIAESGTSPAYTSLTSRWAPILERSRFTSIGFSGHSMGIILGSALAGFLCSLDFIGGWPLVFYGFGGVGVFWFAIYAFTIYSRPEHHPRISDAELEHIKLTAAPSAKVSFIPWLKMICSIRFWAFVVGYFGTDWTMYAMLTCIPLYLSQVINFEMTANGLANALPYVAHFLSTNVVGIISDRLIKKEILTTTKVRKINQFSGSFFPALFLICAGYAGCDKLLVLACLVIGMATFAFSNSGIQANPVDIAPSYSGIIFACGHTFSTLAGFLAPLVMGQIVNNNPHDVHAWRNVLICFSSVIFIAGQFFVILSTGEPQSWGIVPSPPKEENESQPQP